MNPNISLSEEEIENLFAKFPVWTTGFNINGKWYGGEDRALVMDQRLLKLNEVCPVAGKTILEIAPLEAAHTLTLLQLGAKSVTAIEVREENLEKCKIIKKIFGLRKAKFLQGDVRTFDFSTLGKFDIVLCSGILYHLTDPLALIDKLSKLTDNIFLWTHIASETYPVQEDKNRLGKLYKEENSLEAGLESTSLWLYDDVLLNAFRELDFDPQVLSEGMLYGNSAHILIYASKVYG
jgi:SAM-dependent methyltransferase